MSHFARSWSRLTARLQSSLSGVLHRSRLHREVEAERQFHLEAYAADLVREGVSPDEARRRACVELGSGLVQKEKYREAMGLRLLDELGGDLRYGLRSIGKNPFFSAVTVLSLALGIGATTAMFSLIYAVLLHPFPYANADRIMNPAIFNEDNPQELRWFAMTKPQFELLRQAKSLESLLGFRNMDLEISGGELPENVAVVYLTENADSFFGVPAMLGRGIQPSDALPPHEPVVVLNYKFWRRHYNGDSSVIGRTLQLDHVNYTIVGVMPRRFAFNDTLGTGDVYLPRSLLAGNFYTPWMKVKAGVSINQANAEVGQLVHQFAKEFPARFPKKFHMRLEPIAVPYERNTGPMLALLFAGVLLLLLIGCANCSVLMLARGASRQHELAVRSAIGASRWRIVRQLLVESVVISFSGAALGVAASYWLARLPLLLSPTSFPPESVVRINLPILGFSVALALVAGMAVGLAPALRLSRPDVSQAMQSSLRRVGGRRSGRAFHGIIAGQIALTLLLMAGAGMAIGTFLYLSRTPLGYQPKHVMDVGVLMHWTDEKAWKAIQPREARAAFVEQMRQRMAQTPGVLSVSVGVNATPPYSGEERAWEIEGKVDPEQKQARVQLVSPEYFSTLEIPLLAGRLWSAAENKRGDGVVIINETMARHYWPNGNAVGQRIRVPDLKLDAPLVALSADSTGWREIAGVVGDVRNDGLDRPVLPAIYAPYPTFMAPYAEYQIRTQGEPLALVRSIRAAVQSVNADQQIANNVFDLQTAIERDPQWSRQRLFSILFGFFSSMALVLALAGLFSVVAYSVAQRTNEFGVRMALGAQRGHILWVAARNAALSALRGIAIGQVSALLLEGVLARWMSSTHADMRGLMVMTFLLMICTFVACLLPALRAASIRPVEALRYE
jgi:predicted permease